MDERITSMIPQYGQLNRIFTDILSDNDFSFEKQEFISHFYKQYEDTQAFETSLIKLILKADGAHHFLLLDSLKEEIESNISMYNANQTRFDSIDIEYVCQKYADRFNWEIDKQLKITREYSKELTEANGSLEAMVYRIHDRQEKLLLERRYERCKQEYEREKAKLEELYDMKKQATQKALLCLKNRCRDIFNLGNCLLDILKKYINGQKKKGEETTNISPSGNKPDTTPRNQPAYFPMKLVSAIHEVCNGEQFEEISEVDFYAGLNLQPCDSKLKIRPKEKTRVCYLISLMSETLPEQNRKKWIEAIMEMLEIDKKHYNSKYKDPISSTASRKDLKFAKEMHIVFR